MNHPNRPRGARTWRDPDVIPPRDVRERDEERAGLLRELATLTERAEAVRARLREMGDASDPRTPRV